MVILVTVLLLTGLAGRIIAEAILGDDERLSIFEGLKIPSCLWWSNYQRSCDKDWCAVLQVFR